MKRRTSWQSSWGKSSATIRLDLVARNTVLINLFLLQCGVTIGCSSNPTVVQSQERPLLEADVSSLKAAVEGTQWNQYEDIKLAPRSEGGTETAAAESARAASEELTAGLAEITKPQPFQIIGPVDFEVPDVADWRTLLESPHWPMPSPQPIVASNSSFPALSLNVGTLQFSQAGVMASPGLMASPTVPEPAIGHATSLLLAALWVCRRPTHLP